VNEYTRREEVRWTIIAALVLVACMGVAVFMLATAKGPLIPDPAARAQADGAAERVVQAKTCATSAEKLATEIDVFKASAKAARLNAEEPDAGAKPKRTSSRKPPPKEKEPDVAFAWPAAQPTYKQAKALAPCRLATEAAAGERAEAKPAWEAIEKVAQIAPPGTDHNQQIESARSVLKLLESAPVDKVVLATKDAEAEQRKLADKLKSVADTATVREPLPEGIIPRRLAVGIGVALSVITLLLSFLSVRVVSMRRMGVLVPLREAAKMNQSGVHAAAVLRLASQHNGGQPGMVVGAAFGGMLAAVLRPLDSDVFIVGVMGGLLLGLGIQWAIRFVVGPARWRDRATELAEVEKPAIPIVLVLSGVNAGLEGQFIKFFNSLSQADASITVEKLAAQAEEKILAAAEARQQELHMQQFNQQGQPPPGYTPH